MKTLIATASLVAALVAVPLIAQTPPAPARHGGMSGERFKAADTNKDGSLSRAEWDAAQRANDPFTRMDSNKDGKVTEAEMQAFGDAMRAERGSRKGGHGAGRGDPAAFFASADSNMDGAISSAEWQAAGRKPEGFARGDSNGDGKVTKAEFDTLVAQMQARRAGK